MPRRGSLNPQRGHQLLLVAFAEVGQRQGAGFRDQAAKLWQSVEAVRTGQRVACGIAGATPHVLCVNAAQESVQAVTPIPARWVRTTSRGDGTSLVWVDGLQEALEQCFCQGVLPAEIGAVPCRASALALI